MSMKVVFLKDSGEYKAGFEGFIPRPLGSKLCREKVAVPWCMKDRVSPAEKSAITKAKKAREKKIKEEEKAKEKRAQEKKEKKAKEKKAMEEKAKADKLLKERNIPKAETADSKKSKYY